MTEPLIHPDRGAEIRRAAARHAAGMLMISLSEWDPQKYNPDSARNDAEEQLLRDEVERIANELRARALVGTRQPCSVCEFPHTVRADGTIRRHNGVTLAGFSTGTRCDGVGRPPRRPDR
jgi:hypothetical protein